MTTSMIRRLAARGTMLVLAIAALGGIAPTAAAAPPESALVTAPGDGGITIGSMPPGALVLRVGLVGSYWQPDSPANVSVYADGRLVVRDDDVTLGYMTLVLDDAALADLLVLAAAATPFDDVDYGEVMITDVGSTRVELHADQGDAVIEVWALDFVDGLADAQRARRERLIALVAELERLAAGAVEPYSSDTVTVVLRPVLPGMEPEGSPSPWPLADPPTEVFSDTGFRTACLAVPAPSVSALADENVGENLWSLPDGLGLATPRAVAASVTAVLPEQKPCEAFDPVEAARPLTARELAAEPNDWVSPWPQGVRTTTHPFEEWMAVDAMARTVLPAELGGDWSWSRWSWFDYRFAAADVAGRRVIDFRATCSSFVTDEEPACTIDARFDAVTGELLEFAAA